MDVGEVAATTPRDLDLLADLIVVLEKEHPLAAIARREGEEHPGATTADHDHVVVFRNIVAHAASHDIWASKSKAGDEKIAPLRENMSLLSPNKGDATLFPA